MPDSPIDTPSHSPSDTPSDAPSDSPGETESDIPGDSEGEATSDSEGPATGWSVSRGGGDAGSVTFKAAGTGKAERPARRLEQLSAVARTIARRLEGEPTDTEATMSRRELLETLVVLGASGAVAGAVGATASVFSGPKRSRTNSGLGGRGELPGGAFPLGASTKARAKPVQIEFWHSMGSVNQTTLATLTDQFNSAQGDVRVNLVAKTSYLDTVNAYLAATREEHENALPDLVQVQTTDLQLMADTHSIDPVQSAVDADHYAVSDYLPSTLECFKLEGILWALPFNISCQVLYYDQAAFVAAGLDPASPPSSLADLTAAAQKIVSAKTEPYGMSLKLTDVLFENLLALEGSYLSDNDNGRVARSRSVSFDDAEGKAIFTWWSDMLASRLAVATSASTYDNLVGIGRRSAPMTFETSAGLSTIVSVLDEVPGVSVAVAPLPTPTSPRGGRLPAGAGLCIVSRSRPERRDAAWSYIKYLNEPDQQAAWAAATGFVPVRKSAVGLSQLAQVWSSYPGYAVAYEQLAINPANSVTAGAAIGPFTQMQSAIDDALGALSSGESPKKAIDNAARACDQAIASYNSRI